jgi:hypothetical protein
MALGLAAAMSMSMSACSDDDERRDQFYGMDVGANYQLPDGYLDRISDTGGADARDSSVSDSAPGEDAPPGGIPDAAAFQDTGQAADTEIGG